MAVGVRLACLARVAAESGAGVLRLRASAAVATLGDSCVDFVEQAASPHIIQVHTS